MRSSMYDEFAIGPRVETLGDGYIDDRPKEARMYIGVGTVVLILLIVLVLWMVTRSRAV
jgi:hypothetical protein